MDAAQIAQMSLGVGLGIALAAACGFRVFVPLLMASIATRFDLFPVQEGMEWVGSGWAMAAFGTATVVEIGAYYIPWLDNALDTIGVPAAAIAGALVSYTAIADAPPWFAWAVALIAGAGSASTVKVGMAAVRGTSTATTGGLMNWLVSSGENVLSVVLSALAVLLPLIVGALTLLGLGVLAWYIHRARRHPDSATSASG